MTDAEYEDLIGAPAASCPPKPDLNEARHFLEALAPGEPVTFQTFDDTPAKRPLLAQMRHGTLDEHAAFLEKMNAKGAGVFVTVNATDGEGRKRKNIIRPRALFADFDDPAPDTLERLRTDELPPSIMVESSAGKLHAYWLTDELELGEFMSRQKQIAAAWGSDPSVCDLPRVMRLPGFLHNKGKPQPVRLIEASGKRYGLELRERYSASNRPEGTTPTSDDDETAELLALVPTRVNLTSAISDLRAGADVHANALALVGKWMNAGLAENDIRELFANFIAPAVTTARGADRAAELMGTELERMLAGAEAKGYAPIKPDGPALDWVRLDDLMMADIPPVRFLFEPLLPRGDVTLLSADGGTGKSTLALALAAHVACGRDWDTLVAAQGRALFVSLEDPANVCRLRLREVIRTYDLDASRVGRNVRIADGTKGAGALLALQDGKLYPTSVFTELRAALLSEQFDLIVIDNASDAFAGNENDRQEVRTFIRFMRHIARESDAAVLVLAHVDKATVRASSNAAGSRYSGSTAWNNSVRSRLAMLHDAGALALVHEKSNLAKRLDRQIRLDFVNAVPVPLTMIDGYAECTATAEQREAETILALMREAIAKGLDVSAARSGPATTWHLLHAMEGAPADWSRKEGKARFNRLLVRLEAAGQLRREEWKDEYRNKKTRFVPETMKDLLDDLDI